MEDIIKAEYGGELMKGAKELVWQVFLEFEGPCYPEIGIEHFREFLFGDELDRKLKDGSAQMYVCADDGELCGVMTVRDKSHIALAFVKAGFQRRGIGRRLFERIAADAPHTEFTVNASPAGVAFYLSLGFVPTDMERMEDGIIFTPMRRMLKN